jgi:hypothetical protein
MEPFFERGKIRNEKYAKQLNDFRGLLRRRGITPTDIDGLIDYNGKAFIFLEGKHANTALPMGQKMALENIAKAIQDAKREVIVFVFRHNVEQSQQITVADQLVTEIYYQRRWFPPTKKLNVLDAIIIFESLCEKKGIIL